VAIGPNGLNSVRADPIQSPKLKSKRGERAIGIFVNIPHDVDFALAAGARATSTELLQRYKAFAAVFPFNRQFLANWLNV
jgi:hypothetical protein